MYMSFILLLILVKYINGIDLECPDPEDDKKMFICHFNQGSSSPVILEINKNSLDMHLNQHGDFIPGQMINGTHLYDCDCNITDIPPLECPIVLDCALCNGECQDNRDECMGGIIVPHACNDTDNEEDPKCVCCVTNITCEDSTLCTDINGTCISILEEEEENCNGNLFQHKCAGFGCTCCVPNIPPPSTTTTTSGTTSGTTGTTTSSTTGTTSGTTSSTTGTTSGTTSSTTGTTSGTTSSTTGTTSGTTSTTSGTTTTTTGATTSTTTTTGATTSTTTGETTSTTTGATTSSTTSGTTSATTSTTSGTTGATTSTTSGTTSATTSTTSGTTSATTSTTSGTTSGTTGTTSTTTTGGPTPPPTPPNCDIPPNEFCEFLQCAIPILNPEEVDAATWLNDYCICIEKDDCPPPLDRDPNAKFFTIPTMDDVTCSLERFNLDGLLPWALFLFISGTAIFIITTLIQ